MGKDTNLAHSDPAEVVAWHTANEGGDCRKRKRESQRNLRLLCRIEFYHCLCQNLCCSATHFNQTFQGWSLIVRFSFPPRPDLQKC